MGRGYILVCASTDPAWTPLFVNAAGVIMECGGTLSHGAVVAREMGIPAVVLPGATTLFRQDEVVTVDGRHGRVRRSAEAGEGAGAEASPDDTHIPPRLAPPPRSRRERAAARWRNRSLLAWMAYLLAAFLLPAEIVYEPSFAVMDWLLWPIVVALGKPAIVAVVAGSLAALTVVGQRVLTDHHRLREAKRRAAELNRQAGRLPANSPRRAAIRRLAGQVQVRILAATMLPLCLLLGPMIMTFVWFPTRVDPASWNAAPGSAVSVVAAIHSDLRSPVRISVAAPLYLDESSPASRTLPPIRETLEKLLAKRRIRSDLSSQPWEVQEAAERARQETVGDLQAYLQAGVPPRNVMWKVRAPDDASGRFPVTVTAGESPPVTLYVVLGDSHPPEPAKWVGGERSTLKSVRIAYPPSEQKRVFWAPLARLGRPGWDAGWLITYLVAYMPALILLRLVLRIP
jgi:pyruvate,water dikinase